MRGLRPLLHRVALLSGLLASAVACDPVVEPQVVVVLEAGPASSARASHLRVVVFDSERTEVLRRVLSLGPGADVELPARIPITARDGDASRRFELVAELFEGAPPPLEAGSPFNVLRVQGGYEAGRVVELHVELGDACIGHADCGEGRTCWQGACRGACFGLIEDDIGAPVCSECQSCTTSGACTNLATGTTCGCPGDSCQGDQCEPAKSITKVAAGNTQTCALPGARDLHCWGSNDHGQLGLAGSTGERSPQMVGTEFRDFDAGGRAAAAHGCAIVERTAALFCWGSNDDGQLGLGDAVDRDVPTQVGAAEYSRVVTGGAHTCAIDRSGAVYCWGRNAYGQVGAGSVEEYLPIPTRVTSELTFRDLAAGDSHTCALAVDGSVHCWGQNDDGELGLDGDLAPRSIPTRVAALGDMVWATVACGSFHTCALSEAGQVHCWGGNEHGNLGRAGGFADTPQPAPIASSLVFSSLACGGAHCCAIERGTNRLFCWGGSADGEVGDGTTLDARPTPTWVAPGTEWTGLGVGLRHSCALGVSGSLHCWGDNADGQLGVGDTAPRLVPSRVCFP